MVAHWRAWLLIVLFLAPFVAYTVFGVFWLAERHWALWAWGLSFLSWVVVIFLAARWTRAKRAVLPPIDWDAPHTFSEFDRQAWELVQAEAQRSETISIDELAGFDVYIETGRRLAQRLAAHYHPLSHDPIEHVPLFDLLTALELAAEDLAHLARQVPGADLITPAFLKKAAQAADYFQKASDLYTYLLPVFQPLAGLVRLGAQQWMVKPAWRNMQQNLMRWFFDAYVNRLGTHLIELYSGRLVIGAEVYRRLTRKAHRTTHPVADELRVLKVAVVGARPTNKARVIEALDQARAGNLDRIRNGLEGLGLEPSWADRLKDLEWVEIAGYTVNPDGESARDRATRRDAVASAIEADFLILVIDGTRNDFTADLRFAEAWDRWYKEHHGTERPPALAIVTGVDRPEFGGEWAPPYDWKAGRGLREVAVRARVDALRAGLPASITAVIPVGLETNRRYGVVETVLLELASLLHRAERSALIHHLHRASTRSKASRFLSQVGEQGKRVWKLVREPRGKSRLPVEGSRK